MNLYRLLCSLVTSACLLATAAPLRAADSRSADEWQFDGAIYLWAPSMDITPQGGDSIHISFNDIINNLDMTFMGMLGARKGKVSMFADVIYMDLSDDQTGSRKILNQTVNGKVDIGMESWIVTAAGGYDLVDTGKYSLDLFGGARYITVDLPLKFQVGQVAAKTTPSGDLLDGIVGVRGKVDLPDNWYLNYYADGGTGDSASTWQSLVGLNYQFKKFDASFGYRYLTWNMNDKDLEELTVKGPYAGVRFRF
jgi:hypothetical protein